MNGPLIIALSQEVGNFDRERSRVRELIDKEKEGLTMELGKERDRNAGLLRNLTKLENMVEELNKVRPSTTPIPTKVGKDGKTYGAVR